MPDLKFARKTASKDDTKIGYNYYLFFYKNGDKEKENLIYSSIGRTDPTNEVFHNEVAQKLFNTIKERIEEENSKEEKLSPKKLGIG